MREKVSECQRKGHTRLEGAEGAREWRNSFYQGLLSEREEALEEEEAEAVAEAVLEVAADATAEAAAEEVAGTVGCHPRRGRRGAS